MLLTAARPRWIRTCSAAVRHDQRPHHASLFSRSDEHVFDVPGTLSDGSVPKPLGVSSETNEVHESDRSYSRASGILMNHEQERFSRVSSHVSLARTHALIKYLGSKRLLLPAIVRAVRSASLRTTGAKTVLDLFSGTSRVGHALKHAGYRVIANDHNAYAHALARCYVQADAEDVLDDAEKLVREFNAMSVGSGGAGSGGGGYFTETFCVRSRFLQPHNGERVDAIREAIARKGLEPELEAVMLVSLMEAADRVDSTTGVQMAYLKQWSARSFKRLELRVPNVLPQARAGKGEALRLDAFAAAETDEADVVYIDPPYNQHSYLGNYHVWESLVLWDKPPVFGVACKRADVKERRSVFNSRPNAPKAVADLLASVRARCVIVSFSDEGYVQREQLEQALRGLWNAEGSLDILAHDFKRYVGAQIGIHNPRGEKVGSVSHLRNTEYLFIAHAPRAAIARGIKPRSPRVVSTALLAAD